MTWAASRDPGFYCVRYWLDRFRWRVAHVKGAWRLYSGNRVIATAPTAQAMVKRIRILSTTAVQMERIERERNYVIPPAEADEAKKYTSYVADDDGAPNYLISSSQGQRARDASDERAPVVGELDPLRLEGAAVVDLQHSFEGVAEPLLGDRLTDSEAASRPRSRRAA
jgi:hypothetical protein